MSPTGRNGTSAVPTRNERTATLYQEHDGSSEKINPTSQMLNQHCSNLVPASAISSKWHPQRLNFTNKQWTNSKWPHCNSGHCQITPSHYYYIVFSVYSSCVGVSYLWGQDVVCTLAIVYTACTCPPLVSEDDGFVFENSSCHISMCILAWQGRTERKN